MNEVLLNVLNMANSADPGETPPFVASHICKIIAHTCNCIKRVLTIAYSSPLVIELSGCF